MTAACVEIGRRPSCLAGIITVACLITAHCSADEKLRLEELQTLANLFFATHNTPSSVRPSSSEALSPAEECAHIREQGQEQKQHGLVSDAHSRQQRKAQDRYISTQRRSMMTNRQPPAGIVAVGRKDDYPSTQTCLRLMTNTPRPPPMPSPAWSLSQTAPPSGLSIPYLSFRYLITLVNTDC